MAAASTSLLSSSSPFDVFDWSRGIEDKLRPSIAKPNLLADAPSLDFGGEGDKASSLGLERHLESHCQISQGLTT